jgi:hypothetical protein
MAFFTTLCRSQRSSEKGCLKIKFLCPQRYALGMKLFFLEPTVRDLYNHITSDGEEIPLNQMEDTHLLNTVRVFLRCIRRCTKALNNGEVQQTPAEAALYKKSSHNYASQLRQTHEVLMPYITEVMVRGLSHHIAQEVVEAYDRQTARALSGVLLSVPTVEAPPY